MKKHSLKIMTTGCLLFSFEATASTCTDINCKALGYSTENIDGCMEYIYCPLDPSYKKCILKGTDDCSYFTKSDKTDWCDENYLVKCPSDPSLTLCGKVKDGYCGVEGYDSAYQTIDDCPEGEEINLLKFPWGTCGKCVTGCPEGYSSLLQSVADCGTSDDWTFSSTISSTGKICGKCETKPCPSGYSTAYQTVSDCGYGAWNLSSSGTSGGKKCNKCIAKTCSDYTFIAPDGVEHSLSTFSSQNGYMCGAAQRVASGVSTKTCYPCYRCNINMCRDESDVIPVKFGAPFEGCPMGWYALTDVSRGYRNATYGEYTGKCGTAECVTAEEAENYPLAGGSYDECY